MTQLVFDLKCIKGHFVELYLLDFKFYHWWYSTVNFLSEKKGLFSVPFRLSRQFHFCLTLLWFCFQSILTCDRGSEQYLDTIFGVMLSILGCNALWFLLLWCLVQANVSCILSLQNWTWALKQVLKYPLCADDHTTSVSSTLLLCSYSLRKIAHASQNQSNFLCSGLLGIL